MQSSKELLTRIVFKELLLSFSELAVDPVLCALTIAKPLPSSVGTGASFALLCLSLIASM
jgi:hypothetical protein